MRISMRRAALASLVCTGVLGVAASSVAATPTWTGRWRVSGLNIRDGGAVLTLVQRGSTVTGRFPWQLYSDKGFGAGYCYTGKGGTVKGVARRRALTATMIFPANLGHRRATAPFKATISANGRRFEADGEIATGECGSVAVYLVFVGTRIR